jgi:hypothetical protein
MFSLSHRARMHLELAIYGFVGNTRIIAEYPTQISYRPQEPKNKPPGPPKVGRGGKLRRW